MDHKRLLKRIGLVFIGQILLLTPLTVNAAEDDTSTEEAVETAPLIGDLERGKSLFQGGQLFHNGGPSCITCHNVNYDGVMPGGLFAKDLTDVYSRLGEGLTSWLGAPPFKPMAASYNNNPITEQERVDLTAFFKVTNESKSTATSASGDTYFYIGGAIGLICLLGLVQLLWSNRKKKMVKEDIFSRQHKAFDAKF